VKRILNPSQAEAVYSAMCALNNVSGAIRVIFAAEGQKVIKVRQCEDFGSISVIHGFETVERYASQYEFFTAYGLNPDDSEPAYQPTHDEGSTP
jgi:hypothetical protein